MQHFYTLEEVRVQNAWLTIGAFDGVHLGHQEIIHKLTAGARADGAPAVVLTFEPHPTAVLRPDKMHPTLTTPEERASLLEALGVDVVITHPFNREVAGRSARAFLHKLKAHLGFKQFWVGYDFAMGRNREGDIPALRAIGSEMDYALRTVSPQTSDGRVISSSQIRRLLAAGEVDEAAALLGRPYRLHGTVIEGAKRGRTIGIPTANLLAPPGRAVPGGGVYVCQAFINGQSWGAATNVGVRPTFEGADAATSIEAHLLDFAQDIYEKNIQLDFLERIRGEQHFPDVQALVTQIQADVAQVRAQITNRRIKIED